jgi:hypothetical protein
MIKIDSIVRNVLLQKNLPMQYYIRLLSWGLDALRELELDAIGGIKTAELELDNHKQAPLPCDYVDWVRVGTKSGQYILKAGQTKNFSRLLNKVGGVITPFTNPEGTSNVLSYDFPFLEYWYNDHGEALGNVYGGTGTNQDEFMIVPERNVIQMNTNFIEDAVIVMDYIYFDSGSASSFVPRYAESVIQSYMEYKYLCHLPKGNPYDKREASFNYDNEMRKFHARINDLTPEEVERIKDRRFMQSPRLG